jgi:c-di-GMP-binding flagellar brake protein YcgR
MITRKQLRAPLPLPVKIKALDGNKDFELVHLEDISWGGVFVRREPPLEMGKRVIIQFLMRDDSVALEIWGTVVRIREGQVGRPGGNGIQFSELDDATRSLIQRMVTTIIQALFARP